MSNYRKMYSKLFNNMTDTVSHIQKVQQETEEMFINSEPIEIELVKPEIAKAEQSGITRRVDELGRIVLPKEIRKKLGISNHELLEIYIEKKRIIMKKPDNGCVFCGEMKDTSLFKDKYVCPKCRNEIVDLYPCCYK